MGFITIFHHFLGEYVWFTFSKRRSPANLSFEEFDLVTHQGWISFHRRVRLKGSKRLPHQRLQSLQLRKSKLGGETSNIFFIFTRTWEDGPI